MVLRVTDRGVSPTGYVYVSICNSKNCFWVLDVTDQDLSRGEKGLSKSVTSGTVFAELLLQIETFGLDVFLCLNL